MINNNINSDILTAAMDSLSLSYGELINHEMRLEQGLYNVDMVTDFQRHQCMVDPESLEVLGIMSEPAISGYPYYSMHS